MGKGTDTIQKRRQSSKTISFLPQRTKSSANRGSPSKRRNSGASRSELYALTSTKSCGASLASTRYLACLKPFCKTHSSSWLLKMQSQCLMFQSMPSAGEIYQAFFNFFSEEVFLQLLALACFPWYLRDMRDNIGDNLDNRIVPMCRLVGVDYYGFYWKNGSALNRPYGGPALCTHWHVTLPSSDLVRAGGVTLFSSGVIGGG
ncbi:uncharacterized protein G2W53_003583 [Senna tora]|uniref:Uncharacterized protein n=1 Tax=Senna tora TaxID=362788 RepID=A0A834XAF0_9FABA|nr:uncharacterized protein G2W53_003583 [Senna tora]